MIAKWSGNCTSAGSGDYIDVPPDDEDRVRGGLIGLPESKLNGTKAAAVTYDRSQGSGHAQPWAQRHRKTKNSVLEKLFEVHIG